MANKYCLQILLSNKSKTDSLSSVCQIQKLAANTRVLNAVSYIFSASIIRTLSVKSHIDMNMHAIHTQFYATITENTRFLAQNQRYESNNDEVFASI